MSSWSILRRISIILTLAGLAVAGYLTWIHLSNTSVLCTGFGGCEAVQQSRYSEVAGIPVALIGLVGFVTIFTFLIIEEVGQALTDHMPLLIFGLSLAGVVYSGYLTYLEFYVIHAICPYCMVSTALMAGIFGIAVYRVRAMAV